MAFQFDKPLMWAGVRGGGAPKPIKINEYFTVSTINGAKILYRTAPSLAISQPTVLNFSDVEVATGLAYKFCGSYKITEANFPALTTIESGGMLSTFSTCSSLQSANFPVLTSIGSSGMAYAFQYCYSLQTISFPALTTIESQGMQYTFSGCTSLQSISFPALTTIGSSGMYSAFAYCTNLSEIHVPSALSGKYAPSLIYGSAPKGSSIVKYDL